MLFLYNASLRAYKFMLRIVSPFNAKASKMLTGRADIFQQFGSDDLSGCLWIHAPSLGEFEQGRPLIEAYKKKFPDKKVVLSFFSPSGYEIRKDYNLADKVCYLPFDNKSNAQRFIERVKPAYAVFVKYDFWYHYLAELQKQKVPTYLISAIFREDQVFFKPYGAWYRNMLTFFTHLYVQDDESVERLNKYNITHCSKAGDTRFDRVADILSQSKDFSIIKRFSENAKCIVAGSTWPKDEELLVEYVMKNPDIKLILAPHEIDDSHLEKIKRLAPEHSFFYTQMDEQADVESKQILVVDTIGMLSSLYKYGSVAYIGGGFGVGIHNTLEAATYGMPIVFGPNYEKFKEARDLISIGAAHSIATFEALEKVFDGFYNDEDKRKETSELASNYVKKHLGATQVILNELTKNK